MGIFNKRVYLDYASLTPIDSRVLQEMKKYSGRQYANPSSWYREGVAAKNALDMARKSVASSIHAHPDELIFTSGGTESNNIAIKGTIEYLRRQGVEYENMHILIGAIEHSSVSECAKYLNEKGVNVGTVSVNSAGVIDLDDLERQMQPNTALVSIMTVNNEIGTVQPMREIAKIVRHARKEKNIFAFQSEIKYPLLHTDASQGIYQELFVERSGVDLLTLDGTKVYGPRGIGALYVKRGVLVEPLLHGGGQENSKRSGTENIPGILGFAEALRLAENERNNEVARLRELRQYFIAELRAFRSDIIVHGGDTDVSPHILNVSIPGIDSEFFTLKLDAKGVACSTKSSCLHDADESYVLKAIGADSKSSIRFSFGRMTRKSEIKRAIKILKRMLL